MRILVVDDDKDTRDGLRTLLEMEGHEVSEAADSEAALCVAHENRPALVLLDVGLPQRDGFEVAELLRRTVAGTFIVGLTGYGRDEDFVRARRVGFDAYIVKPADVEKLLRLIERVATDPRH